MRKDTRRVAPLNEDAVLAVCPGLDGYCLTILLETGELCLLVGDHAGPHRFESQEARYAVA